jgi:hypothetical protein
MTYLCKLKFQQALKLQAIIFNFICEFLCHIMITFISFIIMANGNKRLKNLNVFTDCVFMNVSKQMYETNNNREYFEILFTSVLNKQVLLSCLM